MMDHSPELGRSGLTHNGYEYVSAIRGRVMIMSVCDVCEEGGARPRNYRELPPPEALREMLRATPRSIM